MSNVKIVMHNTIKPRGKVLTNIQVLRAFAALNVVFFHIIFNAKIYGHPIVFFKFLDGWGSSGVDLFFVISGFVMIYIQHLKQKSPFEFFRDRVFRIVPTYWLFSIFIAILLIVAPSVFKEMVFSASWLFSSLFFISGVTGQKGPIIFVGWTIEYEMLFYLLFAISIFSKTLTKSFLATSLLILSVILIFDAAPIMLEFIFGMAIGWLYVNKTAPAHIALASLILGVASLLLSILFKDSDASRVVMHGIPSAFIVFGCVNIGQMKSNILTKIGDSSYSLYLIQILTIPAFYKLVKVSNVTYLHNDFIAFICILSTVLAGWLVYETYEVKVSNLLKIAKKS